MIYSDKALYLLNNCVPISILLRDCVMGIFDYEITDINNIEQPPVCIITKNGNNIISDVFSCKIKINGDDDYYALKINELLVSSIFSKNDFYSVLYNLLDTLLYNIAPESFYLFTEMGENEYFSVSKDDTNFELIFTSYTKYNSNIFFKNITPNIEIINISGVSNCLEFLSDSPNLIKFSNNNFGIFNKSSKIKSFCIYKYWDNLEYSNKFFRISGSIGLSSNADIHCKEEFNFGDKLYLSEFTNFGIKYE